MIKSRYLTGLLGLSLSLTVLLAACGPGGTSTPHAGGLPLRFAGGHGGALRLSRPLGRASPFYPRNLALRRRAVLLFRRGRRHRPHRQPGGWHRRGLLLHPERGGGGVFHGGCRQLLSLYGQPVTAIPSPWSGRTAPPSTSPTSLRRAPMPSSSTAIRSWPIWP